MLFSDDEERFYYESVPVPDTVEWFKLTEEQRTQPTYQHELGLSVARSISVPKKGDKHKRNDNSNSKSNGRKKAPLKKSAVSSHSTVPNPATEMGRSTAAEVTIKHESEDDDTSSTLANTDSFITSLFPPPVQNLG